MKSPFSDEIASLDLGWTALISGFVHPAMAAESLDEVRLAE